MITFSEFIEKIKEDPSLVESSLRYRKSVHVLPGLKVNITNKGISGVAIGKKGHKPLLTAGKRGIRHSFHLGKGLSFIATSSSKSKSKSGVQRLTKGTNRRKKVKNKVAKKIMSGVG